jgi:hypothetical protein
MDSAPSQYCPAHTAIICQALDLVCFGAFKKLKASTVGDFGEDSVNDRSTKFVQACEQMPSSLTIHGSFRKAGMTPDRSSQPFKLQFHQDGLRVNKRLRDG